MNGLQESAFVLPPLRDAAPVSTVPRIRMELAWTRALFASILALGISISCMFDYFAFRQPDLVGWVHIVARSVLSGVVAGILWWICIAAMDAVGASGRVSYAGYALASIGAAILICALYSVLELGNFEPKASGAPLTLAMWWQVLGSTILHTTLFTAAYRQRVRILESSAIWQRLRLDRVLLARTTMEARLQAMQARIDPALLSDVLADVERSAAAPSRADRMLEGLIDYLHRALPTLDRSSVTLAAEVGLANACFDLARLRMDGQLLVVIETAEKARTARMPPMLLVPLVERVVGSVRSRRFRAVHVTCAVDGDRLRLTVAGTVPGTAWGGLPGNDFDPLRERLTALFGREASLVVESDARESLRAVMEIPYERA